MDKLRAVSYLQAASERGSFSAAAKHLEVSVTAVAKLVTALERDLGVRLVERSTQGLQLTGSGAGYLQACAPLLQQFAEAEEQARANTTRTPGTVVVAVQQIVAQECLTPALPRFHARHPEIRLDVHDLNSIDDIGRSGVDVFLLMGWPRADELVHQRIGAARFAVLASPGYCAAHGTPQRPADLAGHNCLVIRAVDRTVMDLWLFERDGVRETVAVQGNMQVSNAHREMVVDLAVDGAGIIRMLDWTISAVRFRR